MSPSPEAQSPAGDLASAYPPKPLLFTLLGVGAYDMLEQIEKLSRYRTIEQGLQIVAISVTRMLEQIEKLLRYRTIEQGLQNCRNIGHSSKVIPY